MYSRNSSVKIILKKKLLGEREGGGAGQVIDIYQEQERYKYCSLWNSRCDSSRRKCLPIQDNLLILICKETLDPA